MKTVFLALLMSSAFLVNAQTDSKTSTASSQESVEQVRKERSNLQAFNNSSEIAKALEISENEAQKVWAQYEEYNLAKKELKDQHKVAGKRTREVSGSEKASDEQIEAAYRNRLQAKRDKIDLDENYYNKFLEILPASKVQTLIMSERKAKRDGMENHKKQVKTQTRMRQSR